MALRCAVVCALLACLAPWALLRPIGGKWGDVPEQMLREGVHPAPASFPPLVRSLPRTSLGSEQRAALERDGVTVLRGVVQDRAALAALGSSWGKPGQKMSFWLVNGVLRAFARDGPLGALASSALNGSAVRLYSTDSFYNPGGHPGGYVPSSPQGGVHIDLDSTVGYLVPLLSVWLALDDVEHPMEFLGGSHLTNLKHDCPYGADLELDDPCIDRLLREPGAEKLWWDVKAGDAFLFYAQTYHWTVWQASPRAALAFRFVPADQPCDFMDDYVSRLIPCSRKPRWCAPVGSGSSSGIFPVVHPRELSTVDAAPWPIWERPIDRICEWLEPPPPDPRGFGRKLCPA